MVYILIIVLVIYVILFMMLRLGWSNVPAYVDNGKIKHYVKVSVVVVARNEEDNIVALLEGLENQSYSNSFFEVLIVDDSSEDKTVDKIERFIVGSSLDLKLLRLEESLNDNKSKKAGISYAMKFAEGDIVVLTDADCVLQKEWLETIVSFYDEYKPKMIIAPVSYFPSKTFLNNFQVLDFLAMQGVSCSSSGLKRPLICNGANVVYERALFSELNVFEKDEVASGDDIFMLQKTYAKYPDSIRYLKSQASIVSTYSCKSWGELFQQRLRWAGKVRYFDSKESVLMLTYLLIVNIMIIVFALLSPFDIRYLIYFIASFSVKLLVDIVFLWPVAKFFRQSHMLSLVLVVQFVHFIYMAVVGILSNILPYKWKGRKLKK